MVKFLWKMFKELPHMFLNYRSAVGGEILGLVRMFFGGLVDHSYIYILPEEQANNLVFFAPTGQQLCM